MKLSKEELLNKVNEMTIDDDSKIALLEDITDSMELVDESKKSELEAKIEELKTALEEQKAKYKERFLSGAEVPEEKEEPEEMKEEEVIDVKEI